MPSFCRNIFLLSIQNSRKLVLEFDTVILLSNMGPANGLCNGTRLVIRGFQRNAIDAEIVVGGGNGSMSLPIECSMHAPNIKQHHLLHHFWTCVVPPVVIRHRLKVSIPKTAHIASLTKYQDRCEEPPE